MKPLPSKEFRDNVARFKKISAIDPAKIVDEGIELHPAGTRATLKAQAAELDALREQVDFERRQKILAGSVVITACEERDALREQVATFDKRVEQWQGTVDLGKSIDKVKAENRKRWHRENEQRIAELERERDALEARVDDLRVIFSTANSEKRIWRRLNWLHIAQRDDFHATVCKHECTIGELIALLASGSGEDSYEYEYALGLIGAVPDDDVSAPPDAGLDPLTAYYRTSAAIANLEGELQAQIDEQTDASFGLQIWCNELNHDKTWGELVAQGEVILQTEFGPWQELPF